MRDSRDMDWELLSPEKKLARLRHVRAGYPEDSTELPWIDQQIEQLEHMNRKDKNNHV